METIKAHIFAKYIISSLGDRNDTQVFTIERYTGKILYTGQPGIDLFNTPRDALTYLTKKRAVIRNLVYVNLQLSV